MISGQTFVEIQSILLTLHHLRFGCLWTRFLSALVDMLSKSGELFALQKLTNMGSLENLSQHPFDRPRSWHLYSKRWWNDTALGSTLWSHFQCLDLFRVLQEARAWLHDHNPIEKKQPKVPSFEEGEFEKTLANLVQWRHNTLRIPSRLGHVDNEQAEY